MGNLPVLLLNATPLVSRFFAENVKETSKICCVNLENNFSISSKFIDVYCSTIEDKALIIFNWFFEAMNNTTVDSKSGCF
jgi:hypothetical protein